MSCSPAFLRWTLSCAGQWRAGRPRGNQDRYCQGCPSDSRKLVDTLKRCGDLWNRLPVLVGPRGDFANGVLVDTG